MGRMKEIDAMLREGTSLTAIATQIQEWNPSIDRKAAMDTAYKFMKEWRETNE